MGRARCAPTRLWLGGELPGRLADVGLGGHGDVLRGSRGDAAGTELGSSFVERITANVGTVSILACLHAPSMVASRAKAKLHLCRDAVSRSVLDLPPAKQLD